MKMTSTGDQYLLDSQQPLTDGHQAHGSVLSQHSRIAVPHHYSRCQQFPSDSPGEASCSPTNPQLYTDRVGGYQEMNQLAPSTGGHQVLSGSLSECLNHVGLPDQLNLQESESFHHLQMNNPFNIYPFEYETNDSSTPKSVIHARTYLEPIQNCNTPLNPFVEPYQNFTQTDVFLNAAQPTVPLYDLSNVGFKLDFNNMDNHVGPNHLNCVTSSHNYNEELNVQSLNIQGLSQPWENQITQENCHANMNDSSNEINDKLFNSDYTDTIASVASTNCLIRPLDHDNDTSIIDEEIKEICFNCGYTEMISHESKEHGENFINDDSRNEVTSMIRSGGLSSRQPTQESETLETVTESVNPFQHIEEFFHQHLIPVAENDILSLDIQEITPSTVPHFPSSYMQIANNITVADESFLIQSQTNLYDESMTKQDKRALTMQNLHEHSSFLNLTSIEKMSQVCQKALIYLKDDLTFGSLMSLNHMAAKNFSNPAQEISLIDGIKNIDIIPSRKHRQNVIALSISITLLFIAMGSVRNLQSSLNQEGGVGIISMAVSFVGYMLGSIFSSSIVQNFQPRKCIIVSLIPNLVYVAANIYPTLWLMTVVSLIQGISLAIIWNAMSTYITFLSRGHALKMNEDFERASNNFFGIFCLIYQSYHVIGNLIASLVLMPRSSAAISKYANSSFQNVTTNFTIMSSQEGLVFETKAIVPMMLEFDSNIKITNNESFTDLNNLHLCGADFCNHFEVAGSGVTVSSSTKYMLFGIYMGCIVVSIGIAAFILEPLNHRLFHSTITPAQKMKAQLASLAKFFIDIRFLLLVPLLMYSIMQFGFISGEITMAFVTCPLGIHMVGYTMICFGVTASLCSYISGILCKYTGRLPQIITAAALNLAILAFMTQWHTTLSTLIPYFCIMGLWGVSDGIWNCQVNSLMGVIFADKYEEAYAGLRIMQGFGVAILFSYSNLVCMIVKIYIIAAVCVFALLSYLIMEGLLKYRMMQKHIPMKQTSV